MPITSIRNFCIIAHVDHGKSTLADRIIELTHTVAQRDMREQLLDSMAIERERGITIKLQTVRMQFRDALGQRLQLNLVDTPGHVDFSAEVSRSLAACEGALLLVDATQGVQAQTIANLRLALAQGLRVLPVLNKIDSPRAQVERVSAQLRQLPGLDMEHCLQVSARTGAGVLELLEHVAMHFPAPQTVHQAPLRALIFDSHYDAFQGVVMHVRLMDGEIRAGARLQFMNTQHSMEVTAVGAFLPAMTPVEVLRPGEVGFVTAGIKDLERVRIGDTLTELDRPAAVPVMGCEPVKPMVFSGLYPRDNQDADQLRSAIEKLALNDAALQVEPEVSASLGAGFRCGFLGMLHMEIVQERLLSEYGVAVIATAPSVIYQAWLRNGRCLKIDNPAHMPGEDVLDHIDEPYMRCRIYMPERYTGSVMELCNAKRGIYVGLEYTEEQHCVLSYDLPLADMAFDFFNALKSLTHGYASLDHVLSGYRTSRLVRVDILLDEQMIDAFSFIIHQDLAYARAAALVHQLKYVIPRKLYPVPAQAVTGGRVIAREDIPPLRKSALASGFQGSVSQKQRLKRRQNHGQRAREGLARNDIPQEAFLAILALR